MIFYCCTFVVIAMRVMRHLHTDGQIRVHNERAHTCTVFFQRAPEKGRTMRKVNIDAEIKKPPVDCRWLFKSNIKGR